MLARLPGKVGQQPLARFGWPAGSAREVRAKGEALGAELAAREQQRVATLQAAAAQGSRLDAAADALKHGTTEREEETGKLVWRELQAAALYEVVPCPRPAPVPGQQERPSLRTRLPASQATHAPAWTLAPPDQAVRSSYVARTAADARFGAFLWADLRERGLGAPVRDLAVVAAGSPPAGDGGRESVAPARHPADPQPGPAPRPGSTVVREQSPLRRRSGRQMLALERGQVEPVCAALHTLAEAPLDRAPEAAKTARTAATYFADRAAELA